MSDLMFGKSRTVAAGSHTGDFYAISAPFNDVTITSITLANGCTGGDVIAGEVLQQGNTIELFFTAITVSDKAILYLLP